MVDKVVSGHFTHGKCHSSFYESNHRNDNLPFLLICDYLIWSTISRATPYGMWYLALKPSVPTRESTRCLNLPINMVKLKGNG